MLSTSWTQQSTLIPTMGTLTLIAATRGERSVGRYAILTTLRGARNETAVESWGLSYKKEEAVSKSQRPRLILSVRLSPAVAVPVKQLFRVLGANCRSDGMMTTQDASSISGGFSLPLSEQATTAEAHGQKALTVFATVGGVVDVRPSQ